MIQLRFLGHIKTSMGSEEMQIPNDGISVEELFSLLLVSVGGTDLAHGFTKYNTLLVINDEEVFPASTQAARRLQDGDSVMLVPFSHGG